MALFNLCVQDYLRESGVPFALLRTSMFFENAINFTSYQKAAEGSYVYGDNLGTAAHGWHAVADVGHSAAGEQLLACWHAGKGSPVTFADKRGTCGCSGVGGSGQV